MIHKVTFKKKHLNFTNSFIYRHYLHKRKILDKSSLRNCTIITGEKENVSNTEKRQLEDKYEESIKQHGGFVKTFSEPMHNEKPVVNLAHNVV